MSATELHSMNPGDTFNGAVNFIFNPSVPDLAASTWSEPEGFYWKWLLFGRIFEANNVQNSDYDGGFLVGRDRAALHAIGLPSKGSGYRYQAASSDIFKVSVKMGRGMFKKNKVQYVVLQVSPSFVIAAESIDEISPSGGVVRSSQERAFCADFGVEFPN